MIKNHFKIAWRNLLKYRLVSTLNILGLAIGMAACLLIFQFVQYELSYDRFYEDHEEIFRLNTLWQGTESGNQYATTPPPLAQAIRDEMGDDIEGVTRIFYWSDFTMRPDDNFEKVFRETNVYAADRDFFKVLDHGLLAGDPNTALTEPASVVLPKSAAIRYFGEQAFDEGRILGRQLMGGKDAGTPWKVTGVIADQPPNSHLKFDFLISSSTYPRDLHESKVWTWNMCHTYIRVPKSILDRPEGLASIKQKLAGIVNKYALPFMDTTPEQYAAAGNQMIYVMQGLGDIHLQSNFLREMRPNGSLAYVRIFILIGLFVVLIACINYINLFTAQATKRAREVGVRKVMGADKRSLIPQFLLESFLLVCISGLIAMGMVEGFKSIGIKMGLDLSFLNYFGNQWILIFGALLTLLVSLIAGFYPAFYLSHFRPIDVLKGKHSRRFGDGQIRNTLVTFQFVISIGLIASTFVVQQQVQLFQNEKLGFDKENVLVIENDREIEERGLEFREELKRHPGITQASFSSGIPGQSSYMMRDFTVEGSEHSEGISWYRIDEEQLATLKIKLLAGENFDRDKTTDKKGILLNEAAIKKLGLTGPLGKYIIKNRGEEDEERLRIIGVLENFHFESLHHQVRPIALQFFQDFVFKDYVSIRLAAGNPASAIAHVEATWKAFEPDVPLRYSFLDSDYDALYKSEIQLGQMFGLFTGLAIFIACLGLFGLVTFNTEQRTKEIGIRKVLGATAGNIMMMISKDFLRLVLLAMIIAVPLVWYLMNQWLNNFAFRIELQWWMFLAAGASAMIIALATISIQSIKAAMNNPVESLRTE